MINKEITFTITDKHLKLLQQMYVDWNDCDTGAPSIDCKRPYGNSDVPRDIHLILTGKNLSDFDDDLVETLSNEYYELHEETQTALQICLCTQLFETGEYVKKNRYDNRSWVKNLKISIKKIMSPQKDNENIPTEDELNLIHLRNQSEINVDVDDNEWFWLEDIPHWDNEEMYNEYGNPI